MRRLLLPIVAALLPVPMLSTNPALAQEPLVVGIVAPTTGPLTPVGSRQLYAVQWWEQDVNARGGIKGRKVQLIHCNDEGAPDKSATCVRDLMAKGSVVLLNASVTGAIRAGIPLIQNGPVMITPSPNVVPSPSTYAFQTSPADIDLTRAIAGYLKASNKTQLAMIAATDASGEVGVASAAAVFPEAGIKYELARIDLRANDASIQLANVAKPGTALIFSSYTGAGAATVVKSYNNLGLTHPLLISYGNMSDTFINLVRNEMPSRLLGIGLKAVAPEMLEDAASREHVARFTEAYKAWKKESPDQLSLNGLTLADTAYAILSSVDDPKDAPKVKAFLETTPIKSVQTIRFSPTSHVGMTANDAAIVEYKGGRWVKADPLK